MRDTLAEESIPRRILSFPSETCFRALLKSPPLRHKFQIRSDREVATLGVFEVLPREISHYRFLRIVRFVAPRKSASHFGGSSRRPSRVHPFLEVMLSVCTQYFRSVHDVTRHLKSRERIRFRIIFRSKMLLKKSAKEARN